MGPSMSHSAQTSRACEVGDGVLNVNKPAGWTSHDVVAKVRTLLRESKVGHAGTLDPAATGVLPLLIGRGTRIAEYLLDWDKEYRAVLRLGATTDTQDATGATLTTHSLEGLTEQRIHEAVARFQGRLKQIPPMYSAVKVGGVPLYRVARAGRIVEREPREVTVYEIEVLDVRVPDVSLRVRCSKGTYMRTLCVDIGDALGVGGHLQALERRRVGPLVLEQAVTLEDIARRHVTGRLAESLLSLDEVLRTMPAVMVDQPTAQKVVHGAPVPLRAVVEWESLAGKFGQGGPVRIKDQAGRLLAIGVLPVRQGATERANDQSEAALAIQKVLVEV